MELKQLKYFVTVVDSGTMSAAAIQLDMVQSALSQQIAKLESELGARLLHRTNRGVSLTDAGVAFYREAVLTLRHADQATRVAHEAKLSGRVSVGFSPTICAVLGMPLMEMMKERYPEIQLHIVEGMSGHLSQMLNMRLIDISILFNDSGSQRWSISDLFEEELFLMGSVKQLKPNQSPLSLKTIKDYPLILPTGGHGLRNAIDHAFLVEKLKPKVVAEIDSLSLLMNAVASGLGLTIQPWGAALRMGQQIDQLVIQRISKPLITRRSLLCSLSETELSPSALATVVILKECVETLASQNLWRGIKLTRY